MRLTNKNITSYLVDRGFLGTSNLMSGDFTLLQAPSRNCIFKILLDKESGLFVKQLNTIDKPNIYLMQKEATIHYLIHNYKLYDDLREHIPEYFGYDINNHVMVTRNYTNAKNLLDFYYETGKLETNDAIAIAKIMNAFHKDVSLDLPNNSSLQFLAKDVPWILKANDHIYAGQPVLQLIQNDLCLSEALRKLNREWGGNSLIHGDIKLTNFIKIYGKKEKSVKLIDWEIGDIGNPLWDVAGFFQGYLSIWSFHYHAKQSKNDNEVNGNYFWSLENCQKIFRAFWKEYIKDKRWDKQKQKETLIEIVKFTAARLLQTAKEANSNINQQVDQDSTNLINLARNIFQYPEKSVPDLLGIKL